MRALVAVVCLTFAVLSCVDVSADTGQAVDRAVEKACWEITEDLSRRSIEGITNVAVLPLWNDEDGYVHDTLKGLLARTPYSVMVRSQKEWDALLGEIEWGVLREDIMNPATVQKFGRIEGCDAILYGTVRQRSVNPWMFRAVARLNVHMAEVETGRIIWSSGPVGAWVWLEWPEIYELGLQHPVIRLIGLIILVMVVWIAFKRLFRSATRPR